MAYTNEVTMRRIQYLVDTNALGHSWQHFHTTLEMLKDRMFADQTSASSGFCEDFTEEDLKEGILAATESWLDDITIWLNDSDMNYENMRFAIDVDMERVIGTGIYREKWCDWSVGTDCSVLVVILKRTMTKDGGFSLEIVTAFPEPNEEQKRR